MSKTGAIICRKKDVEKGMTYQALLFIKEIPVAINDDALKVKLQWRHLPTDIKQCTEIIYRSDIHSTSNEVQEQFEHLHPADDPVPEVFFSELK